MVQINKLLSPAWQHYLSYSTVHILLVYRYNILSIVVDLAKNERADTKIVFLTLGPYLIILPGEGNSQPRGLSCSLIPLY